MKLMIASDIHGSSLYCKQLISSFNSEMPSQLLLLGDILYHGPRNDLPKGYNPKEVIELLNAINEKIICVRGNCDAEVDQMVLKFNLSETFKLLNVDNQKIFATHGHIYNENNLPDREIKYNIMLNGHTHVPKYKIYDNYIYINVGSVSIPKDNSFHSYVIFENNTFNWKKLNGETYMTLSLT